MVDGDGQETLFDVATGQMTSIDLKRKTYYVQTREDIESYGLKL